MGKYVNPSVTPKIDSYFYIDMSRNIRYAKNEFGTKFSFLCICTPRLFGKTLLADLVAAYFSKGSDSRSFFSSQECSKDEDWDRYLNKVDVIKFDLDAEYKAAQDKTQLFKNLQSKIVQELCNEYPSIGLRKNSLLTTAIERVYTQTGQRFVFIIDNYDIFWRKMEDEPELENLQRTQIGLMNKWFSKKFKDGPIGLAYITGILPLPRKVRLSIVKNFDECTTHNEQLTNILGFSAYELSDYLNDEEKCCDLEKMYCGFYYTGEDRYRFGGKAVNPYSINQAMKYGKLENYWIQQTPENELPSLLNPDIPNLEEALLELLEGAELEGYVWEFKNRFERFSNLDDQFAYLVHYGYLVHNPKWIYCNIPHGMEMYRVWFNSLERSNIFPHLAQIIRASRELIDAADRCDAEGVAAAYAKSRSLSPDKKKGALWRACFTSQCDYTDEPLSCGQLNMFALFPLETQKNVLIICLTDKDKVEESMKYLAHRAERVDYNDEQTRYFNYNFVCIYRDSESETKESPETYKCKIETKQIEPDHHEKLMVIKAKEMEEMEKKRAKEEKERQEMAKNRKIRLLF